MDPSRGWLLYVDLSAVDGALGADAVTYWATAS